MDKSFLKYYQNNLEYLRKLGGTIKIGKPGSRHNTGKKNADINRANRKGSSLSKADQNRLRDII